jgi:hypothetical protein
MLYVLSLCGLNTIDAFLAAGAAAANNGTHLPSLFGLGEHSKMNEVAKRFGKYLSPMRLAASTTGDPKTEQS